MVFVNPYVSIAIAGLGTTNPQFDHFVAEMHADNSGTALLEQLNIKGVWVAANKDYEQQSVEFFRSAQLGTTYYFRVAVADKQKNVSPYSSWVSYVAGSNTAPSPTYTPVVSASSGGIGISAGPSSLTNVDHFEAYWNLTGTAPTSTTLPNLPHSTDGTWSINLASGQTGYIFVRAVDASGNRQSWAQLGGSGVGYESLDGNVFKVPPGTLDGVPDGSTYGRTVATALTSNQIDPSKSGVLMKGSLPPVLSGSFTYTATTTSITISWNSLAILRADGTATNVGTGSQTITGLVAGTAYYFYPYWDEVASAVGFVQSSSLAQAVTPIVGVEMSSTGYVSTATSLTRPTTVSVETWFHSTYTSEAILIDFATPQTGNPTTTDFTLALNSGTVIWNPGSGPVTSPAATYDDGQWHHVVGTYDGTTAKLYVDGVLVVSGAITAASSFTGYWRPTGTAVLLGETTYNAHTAIYSGIILSATQAANHYATMRNSGVAAYEALVLADAATYYWKLTETSGSTAADSVGSNTGTYQGTVTLNQSQAIVASTGSPAYAWNGPLIQAQQEQSLQSHAPLSAGTLSAATPASGTGGGVSGGATGSGGGGNKTIT